MTLLCYGSTTTLYPTKAAADAVAAANAAEDDSWDYRVIENAAGKFVVNIYDEDGLHVGNL